MHLIVILINSDSTYRPVRKRLHQEIDTLITTGQEISAAVYTEYPKVRPLGVESR